MEYGSYHIIEMCLATNMHTAGQVHKLLTVMQV